MTHYCRKPFQGYASWLPYKEANGWFYCDEPEGHEGHDKGFGHKTTGHIKDRPRRTLGREYRGNSGEIAVDVWRYVVVDGKETTYVDRDKGRPIGVIARELSEVLGDMVDEYFGVAATIKYEQPPRVFTPVKLERTADGDYLWPAGYRWIACYAVTGGSEGHYVHVDLIFDVEDTPAGIVRAPLGVFMGKTFQGMEHAQKMAARLAILLGA